MRGSCRFDAACSERTEQAEAIAVGEGARVNRTLSARKRLITMYRPAIYSLERNACDAYRVCVF